MNFFLNSEQKITEEKIEIIDDQVHHFKNVSRGNVGDIVKAFDGKGSVYFGVVSELKKKRLEIKISKQEKVKKKRELNLILGVPKREYLESILKTSVQLGISKVYLLHTRFSPQKYKASPRQEKLLASAVIQSENPYTPEIVLLKDWSDVFALNGEKLSFSTEIAKTKNLAIKSRPLYFIIGPEGGFHQEELELMQNDPQTILVNCPTAIMKAEIAVPYATGLIDSLE